MNDRPCKDRQHEFQVNIDKLIMSCRNCPVKVNTIDVSSRNEIIRLVKQAEQDWYIKELES